MKKSNYQKVFDGVYGAYESITGVIDNLYDIRWDVFESMHVLDNPEVKEVIYSDNVTVVKFADGRKTITRCSKGDEYDREKGILFALVKAAYPDWHEIMSEWCWGKDC